MTVHCHLCHGSPDHFGKQAMTVRSISNASVSLSLDEQIFLRFVQLMAVEGMIHVSVPFSVIDQMDPLRLI